MVNNMPRSILGRTKVEVTRLGIGGAYCQTVEDYQKALDSGVNYLDTARNYRDGEDEKLIGQALQNRRDQVVLASKTDKRTAKEARLDLEASLRFLKTDYIDIYQLHHLNTSIEREQAFANDGVYGEVLRAKQRGLIRFIGVTGHDWKQVGLAVATGNFDTVLCWYNCAMKQAETEIFPHAEEHNVGIVIMNASRNDKLLSSSNVPAPVQFYRYVLSQPSVHLTIMGLRDIKRFQQICRQLCISDHLSLDDQFSLEAYGEKMLKQGKLE